MRAVVLAGGKGARLRPYTVVLPKPLMPIGDYPILEVVVRQLSKSGFDHITLAVNHQAEIIQAFFGDGGKWGVKIDYSMEDAPMGTMGPLKLLSDLPENFLTMNGDVLTDLDLREFYDYHVNNNNLFSIAASHRLLRSEYGVLEINSDNELTGFREKPVIEYDVSMGIYALNKEVLDFIPEGKPYGFDNLMTDMINSAKLPSVKRYEGYWQDIGRPDDYAQAIEDFERMKNGFLKE